jgi:hypothetical protein
MGDTQKISTGQRSIFGFYLQNIFKKNKIASGLSTPEHKLLNLYPRKKPLNLSIRIL